jgi:hypothetical protein
MQQIDAEELFNKIDEAMMTMEKYGVHPTEIAMSPTTRKILIDYINEKGIMAIPAEECTHLCGMKIRTEL